ncbi:MAG: DUF177 domain-containing protein [Alphaproteobacteria bacterium]|jgi:uncharacterized metal-binding protein YceD (DUF177 family)|nr:DUF177 domain-containing protein [Rhodospirillaceae bacterium]MBT6203095.1 DUF177 domain-containing protein [Rhodospirillaceae bacterium]MBT6510486.1 DUF177 domain-containing protein [Rhodospirillaceae bacterium]MBT7648174.1 DUF177 domain-containing protein [Rhodospirillaceae bacterium]MDG2482747.1 DUF177 domain-containing protein [Alphaproteobacteria bacterium]
MQTTEFSRPVDVSNLDDGDYEPHALTADAGDCLTLAKRFAIAELKSLSADLVIRRQGRQVIASGNLKAEAIQTCVVSLDPIEVRIDDAFDVVFDPDVRPSGEFDEVIDLDPDSEDPPEPLFDDEIDLGEAVAQQVALLLDPYPRKPRAEIDPRFVDDEAIERKNPFEVLKSLKLDG